MILRETNMDLFQSDSDAYLAHCISSDFAMGAGIAKEFAKRGVKNELQLNYIHQWNGKGYALYTSIPSFKGCFNLVTKQSYNMKPTYTTVRQALTDMRNQIPDGSKLCMPCIASGLDRLSWEQVKTIILTVFKDKDIQITICYH